MPAIHHFPPNIYTAHMFAALAYMQFTGLLWSLYAIGLASVEIFGPYSIFSDDCGNQNVLDLHESLPRRYSSYILTIYPHD